MIVYKHLTQAISIHENKDFHMKKFILAIFILINSISFAGISEAKIENIFCGEWDAYFIGDACILFLEESNSEKTIIIYDIDEFTYFLNEVNIEDFRELNGGNIAFDKVNYELVTDANLIYEFKNHNKNSLLSNYKKVDLRISKE
jgi:hypothetical protein